MLRAYSLNDRQEYSVKLLQKLLHVFVHIEYMTTDAEFENWLMYQNIRLIVMSQRWKSWNEESNNVREQTKDSGQSEETQILSLPEAQGLQVH